VPAKVSGSEDEENSAKIRKQADDDENPSADDLAVVTCCAGAECESTLPLESPDRSDEGARKMESSCEKLQSFTNSFLSNNKMGISSSSHSGIEKRHNRFSPSATQAITCPPRNLPQSFDLSPSRVR